MKLATTGRNAAADSIKTLIDAGSTGGTIKFYTGAQPANPQTAVSGTLLGTLTFAKPSFAAASTGVITANAITEDSSADATGTAGYARIADSNAVTIMDCSVGTSGADINLNTTAIVTGGPIRITSFTVTQPE